MSATDIIKDCIESLSKAAGEKRALAKDLRRQAEAFENEAAALSTDVDELNAMLTAPEPKPAAKAKAKPSK
jgi:hypothetical protein